MVTHTQAPPCELPVFGQPSLEKIVQDILAPLYDGTRYQNLISVSRGTAPLQVQFIKDLLPEIDGLYAKETVVVGYQKFHRDDDVADAGHSDDEAGDATCKDLSEEDVARLRKQHKVQLNAEMDKLEDEFVKTML